MIYAKQCKKQRKSRKKLKIMLIVASIVSIFALINLYFRKVVNPMIFDNSKIIVQNMTINAMNSAIGDVLGGASIYNDLIEVKYDTNGDVKAILSNPVAINKLNHKLMESGQRKLEMFAETGILVPLGNFTGIPLLSGRGPKINIKVVPVGSMNIEFLNTFSSCGINQTRHQIYIKISTVVDLILPAKNLEILTTDDLVICETIIVGKVPDVYLNSNKVGELINLVP